MLQPKYEGIMMIELKTIHPYRKAIKEAEFREKIIRGLTVITLMTSLLFTDKNFFWLSIPAAYYLRIKKTIPLKELFFACIIEKTVYALSLMNPNFRFASMILTRFMLIIVAQIAIYTFFKWLEYFFDPIPESKRVPYLCQNFLK